MLFLEVDSLIRQICILTLNNFHLGIAIKRGERTCEGELRNTTPNGTFDM